MIHVLTVLIRNGKERGGGRDIEEGVRVRNGTTPCTPQGTETLVYFSTSPKERSPYSREKRKDNTTA